MKQIFKNKAFTSAERFFAGALKIKDIREKIIKADSAADAFGKRNAHLVQLDNRRAAFTLSEVLIALTVIGVIAAITVPALVNNGKEKAYIAAFKEVYSVLAQTNNLLNAENGGDWTVKCTGFGDDKCMRDIFAEKLNYIKKCDKSNTDGCVAASKYKNGDTGWVRSLNLSQNWPAIVTASGFSIKFRMHQAGCVEAAGENTAVCGWSQIDTNGLKGPNTAGKDIFLINYFSDGSAKPWHPDGAYTIEDLRKECDETGQYCGALYMIENK